MSQSITGNVRTFQAGGSIGEFKVVRIGATDNVVHQNSSATTIPVGITLTSASSGENVPVIINGTAKCVAVAAITRGATVVADDSEAGKARTTTTANDKVLGIALESTAQTLTSAGTEVIEIDLTPRGSNF